MPRRLIDRRSLALLAAITGLASAGCSSTDSSTAAELSQPAKLTLVSGDAQSGNGSTLPTALVVMVSDPRNQPVANVSISWSASDPTASVTTATTTDAQGQAKAIWTLGASAGRQTVTATTPALPGAQVVFQANSGGVLSGGVTVQL